ncbi:MAG: TIGR02234 family membrane protein [Mycobacterium sp.]|nr:TIGR02234 family membrane protein [Mycobacterium sp.]
MIRLAQLLLVLSAAALWVASRLPWVSVTSADGLGPERTTTLNGAAWSNGLLPMALLLLAAALAGLAVRGWLLRAVASLLAVVCLAMGYLGVSLLALPDVAPRGAELADVPVATLVASERYPGGAVVTMVAAVAVLAAAVLMMRSANKAHAATKYETTGTAGNKPTEALSERGLWDALDEGLDPTGDTEGR